MSLVDALDEQGDSLTTSNASRANTKLSLPPSELVDKVSSDSWARCTKRMAKGNSTSIDVELAHVKTQLLGTSQSLGTKCLIDLKRIKQ